MVLLFWEIATSSFAEVSETVQQVSFQVISESLFSHLYPHLCSQNNQSAEEALM